MNNATITVFVLKGMSENHEYGGLEIGEVLGVYTSRENAENDAAKLVSAGRLHSDAAMKARKICDANKIPCDAYNHAIMDVWNAAMNKEYNRILGTEGLNLYKEAKRFFDDYEITELPLL